jgi:hypothetical protein
MRRQKYCHHIAASAQEGHRQAHRTQDTGGIGAGPHCCELYTANYSPIIINDIIRPAATAVRGLLSCSLLGIQVLRGPRQKYSNGI